jgi:hypothetical protein
VAACVETLESWLGAMYLTKKQQKQGGKGTLLALPCERCGCGIRVKTLEQKKSWDEMGVSRHKREHACDRLRADREAEEAQAARDARGGGGGGGSAAGSGGGGGAAASGVATMAKRKPLQQNQVQQKKKKKKPSTTRQPSAPRHMGASAGSASNENVAAAASTTGGAAAAASAAGGAAGGTPHARSRRRSLAQVQARGNDDDDDDFQPDATKLDVAAGEKIRYAQRMPPPPPPATPSRHAISLDIVSSEVATSEVVSHLLLLFALSGQPPHSCGGEGEEGR